MGLHIAYLILSYEGGDNSILIIGNSWRGWLRVEPLLFCIKDDCRWHTPWDCDSTSNILYRLTWHTTLYFQG